MEFLNPTNLWLLIAAPVAWIFILFGDEKRRKNCKALNISLPSPKLLSGKLIINTLFLSLLVLATARPYSGFDEVKRERVGSDNLIILDISDSMRAKDTHPTRLEVAKRKVWDLANLVKENAPGDRIGLILFAGQAYLYCPPTVDFAALKQFLSHIKPELISAQGSGINLALTTTIEVIKRTKMKSPRIFIFTDGEDRGFYEPEAIQTLGAGDLTPRILGIGTTEGGPIDIPGQGYIRDGAGKIVISKLNREALSKLAKNTEGLYTDSTIGDSDLKLLLSLKDKSNELPADKSTTSVRIYNEWGHVLIWLAILILALGAFNKKLLPLTILLLCISANPVLAEPNTYEAWQSYQNEDYEVAKDGFESALKNSPDSPQLLQSLGSSYYKLNQLADAERLFLALTDKAKSREQKFNGYFNLGNSRLKQQNLEGAISSYEDALRLKPDDEAAKFNLEYAKQLRQQKQEEQNKEKEKQKQDQQQAKNDQSQQNPEQEDSSPNKEEEVNESSQPQDKKESESDKQSGENSESKKNEQSSSSEATENSQQDSSGNPQNDKQLNEKELADKEARKWLDSLPDSPIQIRKDNRRVRTQNGQTW